ARQRTSDIIQHFYCSIHLRDLHAFPTRRSSDLALGAAGTAAGAASMAGSAVMSGAQNISGGASAIKAAIQKAQGSADGGSGMPRSEEHTSELQSRENLVCRLLLEKKK